MTNEEIKKLQDENAFLKEEVNRLKDEIIRLVGRNLTYRNNWRKMSNCAVVRR